MSTKAAFLCNSEANLARVYGKGRRETIAALTDLYPVTVSETNFADHAGALRQTEVIFSTWGMPALSAEEIARLPELKAVFYAAGSVQGFARPFLEAGITVMSAWGANGVPVAEFALAQILLSCKGYFQNTRDCRDPEKRRGKAYRGPGIFDETVALLGAGMIGRMVIERLRPFALNIIVFDPFLTDARAAELGVTKVSLEEAFQQAVVVSNHLANLPATVGMLEGRHFAMMREGAAFINTGRGATVKEEEMIAVLQQRPDLLALLDVTNPEPPVPESPLYTMPNVQLSAHIAGSMNNEVVRMADYAIEEFKRWEAGQPLSYAVSLKMLETMA